jgi:branched-subunit amino acid aminotransferase/4-amino-4-deoxychorismate lyase
MAASAMIGWLWNGDAFERCDSVPLSDRGFRYGMAVFESLRVAGGEAEFFDAHLARLLAACGERELAVEEGTLRAAEGLLATSGDGFARLYVTAGDGAPTAPAAQPRIFLFIEPRDPPADESCEITIHDEPYRAPFGGLKTANYWFNADALAQARRRGFDETLLFNDLAELVSASMANVFLVHEGRLATPSRSSGARAGVIREWVIARRRVEERRLRRDDVLSADEIFLTNSWLGVMPVATLEGRPLGPRRVGPRLAAELRPAQ